MKTQEYEIEKDGQLRLIFHKHKQLLIEFKEKANEKTRTN